jgi:hypothetical protein
VGVNNRETQTKKGCNMKLLTRLKKAQKCKGSQSRRWKTPSRKMKIAQTVNRPRKNFIYCQETFSHSKGGEGWVKCSFCGYWTHEAFTWVEEDDYDEYSCDMCKHIKQKWLALVHHCSLKAIPWFPYPVIQIMKFILLQNIDSISPYLSGKTGYLHYFTKSIVKTKPLYETKK